MPALSFPIETPPENGTAVEIADGVLWIRMPLPMALDHVNVYAFRDGKGWALVDGGIYSKLSIDMWENVLSGPLGGDPITDILLTHYHPDHVGMVGWLQKEKDAHLIATRLTFTLARMLILDEQETMSEASFNFYRAAGVPLNLLEPERAERPFNFADRCAPLQPGYTSIAEGQRIRFGGRDWDVHIGEGHAHSHATLWEVGGDLVIAGDQIIAGITPNVSIYPTEPLADNMAEWLESCERLQQYCRPEQLALSGHKLPFYGIQTRLQQLIDEHINAFDRLLTFLETPHSAAETFPILFKRNIGRGEFGLALGEAVAHLNYLYHRGQVTRELSPEGAYLYQKVG